MSPTEESYKVVPQTECQLDTAEAMTEDYNVISQTECFPASVGIAIGWWETKSVQSAVNVETFATAFVKDVTLGTWTQRVWQRDWDPAEDPRLAHDCLYATLSAHVRRRAARPGDAKQMRALIRYWWLQNPAWLQQTASSEQMSPSKYLKTYVEQGWGGVPELQLFSRCAQDCQFEVVDGNKNLIWSPGPGPKRNRFIFHDEHYKLEAVMQHANGANDDEEWSCSGQDESLEVPRSGRGGMPPRRHRSRSAQRSRVRLTPAPDRRERQDQDEWVRVSPERDDQGDRRARPPTLRPARRHRSEPADRRHHREDRGDDRHHEADRRQEVHRPRRDGDFRHDEDRQHGQHQQARPRQASPQPRQPDAHLDERGRPLRRPVLELNHQGRAFCLICRR